MADKGLTPVSMRRSAKEKKREESPMATSPGRDYGWGLSVNLDHDHIAKLGMKELPAGGSKVKIMAHARVTRSSEESDEGGKPRRGMSLQITHLALDKPSTVAVRRVAGVAPAAAAPKAAAKIIKTKRA